MSGEIYAVTPDGEEVPFMIDSDGSVWIMVMTKYDKTPKNTKIQIRRVKNGKRNPT